ncbi:MAG TPA: hypothetical protein VMT20_16035 [Terriglobia bacterium]|nr:hypothetical protein [Terriglobia bacterium]
MRLWRQSGREERRQRRELTLLFAGRFWENDLVSITGDVRGTLVGVFAVVAGPGWILPFLECLAFSDKRFTSLPLYERDWIALPHKAIYLALSMTVLGILTVFEWDALLLDQRDYSVLRPLPVRLTTVLAAKLSALAFFWAVLAVVINAVSALIFPVAVMQWGSLGSLLWMIRVHVVAIVAGNAFVFLAMIALQGLLMNVSGWHRYRRVSPYFQLLLVALLLLMFFASIGASQQIQAGKQLGSVLRLLPPVWFLGLYQYDLGWHQPVFHQLATLAQYALGTAAFIAAAFYGLSYKRSISDLPEHLEIRRDRGPGRFARIITLVVDSVLLRTPPERAAFHFIRQTTLRSRSHRVLVAAYAGIGLGLVFQSLTGAAAAGSHSWWDHPQGALLPIPLVLSLFLLLGLRYAFTVPAELRANWLFQLSATSDPREYRAGIRKAVTLIGILPLFALLLPLHAILWGWRLAGLHIAFGFVVACLVMDVLFAGFDTLPFTCSHVAGKANVKTLWPLYVLGFMAFVSAFSGIELLILNRPGRLLWFLGTVVLIQMGLEFYRRRVLPVRGTFSLVFAGEPEPAVRTLGLSH